MKTVKAYVASSERERLEAELRANVKPRAGEHTKDYATEARRPFTDPLEAANYHAARAIRAEAERDQLRAREAELVEALRTAHKAMNPLDRGGISLHTWNGRLKRATATIDAALSKVRGA